VVSPASQAIYQTEWTGGQTNGVAAGAVAFSYNIPVSNGSYLVRLHFAELNKNGEGLRVFDVNIEGGEKELTLFDIFKEAGGVGKAIVKEFNIDISDGALNIDFIRQVENAKISAIEVLPVSDAVARIIMDSEQHVSSETFTVYPNPVHGEFTVDYFSLTPHQVDIRIMNAQSKIITQKSVSLHEGNNLIVLGKEILPAGLYIIQIASPDHTLVKKFIVTK
jgi:hypothetical protein